EHEPLGLIDNWLRHVRRIALLHSDRLTTLRDAAARAERLCELNVLEQVMHVCESTVVTSAWQRGQPVSVHGWIYRLSDGLRRDLGFTVTRAGGVEHGFRSAVDGLWTSQR